jgi:hypothetical protein
LVISMRSPAWARRIHSLAFWRSSRTPIRSMCTQRSTRGRQRTAEPSRRSHGLTGHGLPSSLEQAATTHATTTTRTNGRTSIPLSVPATLVPEDIVAAALWHHPTLARRRSASPRHGDALPQTIAGRTSRKCAQPGWETMARPVVRPARRRCATHRRCSSEAPVSAGEPRSLARVCTGRSCEPPRIRAVRIYWDPATTAGVF